VLGRQFPDLDSGLGIIGRQAKSLGYNGVLLFLDELVLAGSRASDVSSTTKCRRW
jgi:hypothetical protein